LEAGCLQRRRQRGRRAGPVSRSASPPRGTTRPRPARRAQPTRPASPETSNRLATEPRKSFQEIPQEGSAVPLLGQPFRRAVRLEALQRRRLERRRQRRPQAGTVSRSATRRGVLRRSPLAARRAQPARPALPETCNRLGTELRNPFQEIPEEGSAVPGQGQPARRAVRAGGAPEAGSPERQHHERRTQAPPRGAQD
jgi:hypothetical protein